MSSDAQQAAASSREASRRAYETVVEVVRRQTGAVEQHTRGSRGATVSVRGVRTVAVAHGSLEPDEFDVALQQALANDDLARYGQELAVATVAHLRAVVREEAASSDPIRAKIGTVNQWIDALEERGKP